MFLFPQFGIFFSFFFCSLSRVLYTNNCRLYIDVFSLNKVVFDFFDGWMRFQVHNRKKPKHFNQLIFLPHTHTHTQSSLEWRTLVSYSFSLYFILLSILAYSVFFSCGNPSKMLRADIMRMLGEL